MIARTKEKDDLILDRHIAISRDGFEALQKVTAFCCAGVRALRQYLSCGFHCL